MWHKRFFNMEFYSVFGFSYQIDVSWRNVAGRVSIFSCWEWTQRSNKRDSSSSPAQVTFLLISWDDLAKRARSVASADLLCFLRWIIKGIKLYSKALVHFEVCLYIFDISGGQQQQQQNRAQKAMSGDSGSTSTILAPENASAAPCLKGLGIEVRALCALVTYGDFNALWLGKLDKKEKELFHLKSWWGRRSTIVVGQKCWTYRYQFLALQVRFVFNISIVCNSTSSKQLFY